MAILRTPHAGPAMSRKLRLPQHPAARSAIRPWLTRSSYLALRSSPSSFPMRSVSLSALNSVSTTSNFRSSDAFSAVVYDTSRLASRRNPLRVRRSGHEVNKCSRAGHQLAEVTAGRGAFINGSQRSVKQPRLGALCHTPRTKARHANGEAQQVVPECEAIVVNAVATCMFATPLGSHACRLCHAAPPH